MKTAPFMTDAHAPLRCKFTDRPSQSSDRLELSSIFVCVVEAQQGAAPFEGAFIESNKTLSWAGNNSKKYPPSTHGACPDVWTLVSTPQYGTANKCPQEAIPDDVWDKVTSEMTASFGRLIGANTKSWRPLHLQL